MSVRRRLTRAALWGGGLALALLAAAYWLQYLMWAALPAGIFGTGALLVGLLAPRGTFRGEERTR